MPRASTPITAARGYRAKYDAKRRAQGWQRGPRITAEAAERLRVLAFQHRLDPCEVVSRLILEIPLAQDKGAGPIPLSPAERAYMEQL